MRRFPRFSVAGLTFHFMVWLKTFVFYNLTYRTRDLLLRVFPSTIPSKIITYSLNLRISPIHSFSLWFILFYSDILSLTKTLSKTSSLVILRVQPIFCIILLRHISKTFILLISSFEIVHVSHPYSIMSQIYVSSIHEIQNRFMYKKKKKNVWGVDHLCTDIRV